MVGEVGVSDVRGTECGQGRRGGVGGDESASSLASSSSSTPPLTGQSPLVRDRSATGRAVGPAGVVG